MKHQLLLGILCILTLTCLCSCENKESETKEDIEGLMKNIQPEYNSKFQVICYKELIRYDIKSEIALPLNINNPKKFDFACDFLFFNYGEDICLFKDYGEDCFIIGVATINYIYVLKKEDQINIVNKEHNKKYGDWALVNLTLGNDHINDVCMTPLAMKAYKNGEDDSFVFIQFVDDNKYMNVLFYGGPTECLIVKEYPECIIPSGSSSSYNIRPLSGHSQFWHQK